jgi:hypothetical protein
LDKSTIVTPDLVIISDHRHWKAVSLLRWETVPVEVRKFPDQKAELEALLLRMPLVSKPQSKRQEKD